MPTPPNQQQPTPNQIVSCIGCLGIVVLLIIFGISGTDHTPPTPLNVPLLLGQHPSFVEQIVGPPTSIERYENDDPDLPGGHHRGFEHNGLLGVVAYDAASISRELHIDAATPDFGYQSDWPAILRHSGFDGLGPPDIPDGCMWANRGYRGKRYKIVLPLSPRGDRVCGCVFILLGPRNRPYSSPTPYPGLYGRRTFRGDDLFRR